MSKDQSVEQPDRDTVTPAEQEAQESGASAADTPKQPAGDAPERGTPDEAESGAEPATGDSATAEIDELREALRRAEERANAAEEKAKDHWERLLRTEAEKDNVRKRAERDSDSARRYAVENFAAELLAVRDSLELGLEAARQEDADIEKIREGTELTYRMLTQVMEKFDIEEIDPVGEKFNPDLHQAMSMQEVEGHESNTVISVMQKGYRLNERLLRPALVMVAK